MRKAHHLSLLVSAAAVALIAPLALRKAPATIPASDLLGEICSAEDEGSVPAEELLTTLTGYEGAEAGDDHGHAMLQSRVSDGQLPVATRFDPDHAEVSFELGPTSGDTVIAGQELRATVRITDSRSGLPVSGRSVAGWMMLQRNAQVSAEMPCSAKARLFTQGRVTARPDVDLNSARLLVLNRDGSVAVVNPQVDFTITQMEGVIPLPGVPGDWALSADGRTVFVSLPVYGAVAVIDARAFRITALIDFPKGSLPTQLLPLPGGKLAVFLSAPGSLTIASPDGSGQTEPVMIGEGPVALATGDPGAVFAASSSGRLVRIDTRTGKALASATIAGPEPSLAWSPRNGTLYAATRDAMAITAFGGQDLGEIGRIRTEPGLSALALDPAGIHLIALNRDRDQLSLIDPASSAILAQARMPDQPVEITFSHDYAYVRGLASDHFAVLELDQLSKGRLAPVDVQSASGPVVAQEALSHARMIAPYGHGALIGNAGEAVAYYYMEGMNSPMGTVKTYGAAVQGLMTIDRGFRETQPGVYETTAILPFGGTYDVPVAVDGDGFVTCFTASAGPAAREGGAASTTLLRVEAVEDEGLVAKRPGRVVFRLIDDATGKPRDGLRDVRILTFAPSGSWQARKYAKALGDGRYAADWTFPTAGRYGFSIEVVSLDQGFSDRSPLYFKVGASPAGFSGQKEVMP